MNDAQRAAIREALRPAILKIFHETMTDSRPPGEDDDFSGREALFDNLALGITGVANGLIEEYRVEFRKGMASVRAGIRVPTGK